LQSYCTGDSSTSCQKPSAIEIFKGTTVVQGEITLDLPTFEPDYKGTLAWMRISVTVELTGNPYVATELFEGIQLVSPSGAFAPIVLVGPQSACGSNGIGRDCFPVGQNNHTFTLPDVTRFPSSADSLKSILGKNPPADGYFLRVLGPKGIKVPNWIVEVGFK
jgi:hypothetical protein